MLCISSYVDFCKMEILQKFKENGYFTADLYHLLVNKKLQDSSTDRCEKSLVIYPGHELLPNEPFQILPSQYEKEMKMSAQERLQNLNNIEIDNIIYNGDKSPKVVLSFTPRLIVFQNFKPNEKIVAKFTIQNISKAPTFISMVFKESSYFSIKLCSGQLLSRLAPGICITFAVIFTPAHYEDYIHRITFYTDVDQYVLPLIAMGPRPIFDFPDRIDIPKTPLKVENHVLVTVHNVGLIAAGFTLSTKCPYSVEPKSAYLKPNESIKIKVKFKTMYLGNSEGLLYAFVETGENFIIRLSGCTHTVKIDLEKEVVRFFDTYNTMVRQQTYKIVNKSDHPLTYMCLKNESVYQDFEEKMKLATIFYNVTENETAKDQKLVFYDVLSSDEHERVYTRIFYDEIHSLVADESLYFQNMHFSITPIKGNLWPNKPTELTITFSPKEIGEFHTIAYLDIDGLLDRAPLKLVGISIPPSIQLNTETLDINNVYINTPYKYEVVATNKGHINGVIAYREVATLFGSVISCYPQMYCLKPGDKGTFIISFLNSNQGLFFEEINFTIRDTSVVLKLYLKGEVIYPTLNFSIPCLDFGNISVGVPNTQELDVINESVVSVVGSVKISSDGPEISSLTLEDYAAADMPKPKIPQWPREFNIEPCKVNLAPQSRITLKVTLIANLTRANQTSLELELEKSDSPPIVLPVVYNAVVPEVTRAPDILMRACFIDFPYEYEIVVNSDNFRGYYTVAEPEEETTLQVDVVEKEGYIEANSTLRLNITILTAVLGTHEYALRLNLFGLSKAIEICTITAIGVRPIVTCTPMALHWGQVKLLTTSQKTLTLCNDSPVVVNFKASLLNKDGRWQISPNEGYIQPEAETDLVLTLYLIDANTYTNKAVLVLEKVKDILVPLSATGVGTSIIVGELRDRIELGRHFTRIPLQCSVIMENCGTRMHTMEWSEHYKAPKTKQPSSGFFNFEPRQIKMAAGEKLELLVTGLSHKVTTVKEMWYLVGSVEGINKKELLLECQVVAEFVDPKIEVSASVLEFQYNYGPYSEYYKLTDIVTIKNVSKLPLEMEISLKPPFAAIQRNDTYIIPPEDVNLCCCTQYLESDPRVQKLLKTLGPYEPPQFVDYFTAEPVKHLREGSLEFFRDINKIKLAFNLTHMVEERLEDQDVMKLQILFDTTKHASLKSKIFSDVMRIKFKGHKNKDMIKVIGQINFPNILVLTPRVDFHCILNGSVESKTIKIQNITPLVVCYRFHWKKSKIDYPDYPKTEYRDITSVLGTSDGTTTSGFRENLFQEETLKSEKGIDGVHWNLGYMKENRTINNYYLDTLTSEYSKMNLELFKRRIIKKITPMIDAEVENQFEWIHKLGKKEKVKRSDINAMLSVVPHRGVLKPGEIQYVHVVFQPKPNINVRAILECEILGGPPETIQVTGRSSDLRYKMSGQRINFKIRSFHENAIEELTISNIAELPFTYKTYKTEVKDKSFIALKGDIVELLPPERVLDPEEDIKMQIVVHPGVVGYFHRTFILEIGHLPHMPIEVFGWGVIPQVYLTLHRPKSTLPPTIGYEAIPALTYDYLAAIHDIFIKSGSEHLNSPLTDKCFEDPVFQKDWHICASWDGLPSTMDIDMAIERHLIIKHIKERPEILTPYVTSNKTGPIPGFYTTPYIIDYGVVITGSTAQCIAEIINYGPIATKLHFAKGTNIPNWLSLKLCGKLNPGEVGKLESIFFPTSNDFTELEQNVEAFFNIEVPYGVTIPIQVKALCAVPYLMSNVSIIDFGSVRCGDKVIYTLPLKNVGKPTCIWYATLRLRAPGPAPMVVMDSSGKYEPEEGGWLSISFKPPMEMLYEGLLIFRFHMNPNRMTIPVVGQGIVPHVHVIGPNVQFPPTLPWAETSFIYFGLTNPCPFPIELIIAHSDEKWEEEEAIYQLLYKYYNKPDEILVPVIKPGHGLPLDIVLFYKNFTERVKKIKDEEALASAKTTAKASATAKKAAAKPTGKGTKTTVLQADKDAAAKPKFRSEAEIIADEIKRLKLLNIDPLKSCLSALDESNEETVDLHTKGFLVFVHGSPCEEMQCQEIAYAVGQDLGLPVINMDKCIVEALLSDVDSPPKEVLMGAINDTYESIKRTLKEDAGGEHEEDFYETQDEFEICFNKIEILATSKNMTTPRAKGGDKKKKKSTTSVVSSLTEQVFGTTTLFRTELIEELLIPFLKQPMFDRGFVVESLNSIVLKSPPLALTTFLRCKNSTWNAQLILCHSDFAKWAHAYDDSHKESEYLTDEIPKVYEEAEIEAIVTSFEAMDDEEYEKAPVELKAIYIEHGLEARRNKYLEKLASDTAQSPSQLNKLPKDKAKEQQSKSLLTVDGVDSKKKGKKEETKGGKMSTYYQAMSLKYNDYTKNIYEALVSIAINWNFEECDLAYPLLSMNGAVSNSGMKKPKKKSEIQLNASEPDEKDRGFLLSLIMCPCQNYKLAVQKMLKNSAIVKAALKVEGRFDVLKCPVKRQEYTVLLPKTFPSINHEKPLKWKYLDEVLIRKCECNQLNDLHLLDDSTQDNVLNILSKWHCVCGKKMASSQTSTTEVPSTTVDKLVGEDDSEIYPLPLHSVRSLTAPNSRLILQPGDLVRCKYSFAPQDEGNFSVKRFVEVSGWPNSRVEINVNGICDIPRLDSRPKKMFENFVRRTTEDYVYKITYLDDVKVFEFGPIFVGDNRIYEERYSIDLKNASLITAYVDIEFLEETDVFQIDKAFIRLEPGFRDKLVISAAPAIEGIHQSTLLFCIKDNPEIMTVNIACSGVKPIVQILPVTKTIEYGKLLLYRRADDRFIVKNDSILPVMWKINNRQDFLEDFIISQTSGIVPRHDNQVVPVTYIACRVGVIQNKTLAIDIYDEKGRGDPMLMENLYLSAECYDVMVECAYENRFENFLNYGNVKVNSVVYRQVFLLNRGKYNIYYKLKKVKNFPEPSLLKSFVAYPDTGVIPATGKLLAIEFECMPTTSMNLHNVPAYTCSLLDNSKAQVVVAKFPIGVSIASFYNTFTLFPLGELNFHIIAIGTSISREVILNNTSKCPVTYEIVLPPQYQIDPNQIVTTPKKDNKIRNPPLKCGNFLIMNEDNLLAPGTSRTIQIQFLATSARKFEETINFVISDTCPAEAQGVPLRLVGTGAVPTLDFWNIEITFREHLIVKHLSEYKVPESSPHCVFAENSVTLYFFCVTVNTRFTASLDLYNNGLVACALTMALHYQSNTNADIFSLDKYDTHIEPLMHRNLGIIFSPKALKEYRAVLEIKLKLLDNQEQSFKVCLVGEGVIPRIKMLSPKVKNHGLGVLQLPVTCLGSVENKPIRFKNISSLKAIVELRILKATIEKRPIFWLSAAQNTEHMLLINKDPNAMSFSCDDEFNINLKVILKPDDEATVNINYNPLRKGRTSCDVRLSIVANPFEYFTITCDAEAFMEDVILIGLKMLPMDTDLEFYRAFPEGQGIIQTVTDENKKASVKSVSLDRKKSIRTTDDLKRSQKKMSGTSVSVNSNSTHPSQLKYVLDFGGCELSSLQRRSVVMVNNSEKVYRFTWNNVDHLLVKPSVGYISPSEEKDLEIMFHSIQPVTIQREFLNCTLTAVSDDTLTLDIKDATWDNRQLVTAFARNPDISLNQRQEMVIDEQVIQPSEAFLGTISMVLIYSATVEYTKYDCRLPEEKVLEDTFIYQTRNFDFTVKNVGNVPMKLVWSFIIDDEYPARIDKNTSNTISEFNEENGESMMESYNSVTDQLQQAEGASSKVTLFSGSLERQSVDTWFEIDLPFKIEPAKACLKPNQSKKFRVTFSPLDAFDFKVKLKSDIDNLDPYDQNITCRLSARSLIPYVHLDIEESDYLTSGRRKVTGVALPLHMTVLEFNVLGSGCYKKTFDVINPTSEAYEFIFEMTMSDKPDLIPIHCDMLKGYVEGGTSTEVTFTFSPTAPGVYESQWKFIIPAHNLVINLLVVGLVREPDVMFVPTILIIRNSLVGFTTTHDIILKNNEAEPLKFEFKGDSLCKESGETPVIPEPGQGILKPNSETTIKIFYTPAIDGPLSFKIFCSVTYLTKYITLCVNALSDSIRPKVLYYLIGNEHVLNHEVNTNIYLDQTASTYQRTIPFIIKNNGSATFFFDWHYNTSHVKKYLQMYIEPKSGHVTPANEIECTLFFTLTKVPVQGFPVVLAISDGPEYCIFLYAEIEKPVYTFSCMDVDFGKCFINVPDTTYKKSIAFTNGDQNAIILDLNFSNLPELVIDYKKVSKVQPGERFKVTMYFRPKQVKEYEFKLQFWVNSLCEEIVTVKGEGIPLLFDLYEGCQKSFDLGHVNVGNKIIRTIEVMNHSKMPIDATYIFRDMYGLVEDTTQSNATSLCLSPSVVNMQTTDAGPSRVQMLQKYKDDNVRAQIAKDIENALSSLKVVPNKCTIKPYRKVPLKIQFKPVGLISTLSVQLNMKVFQFERPLVCLSGCATGMSLCFNQNSLQFGRVRKRGCKILKVMLLNKGSYGARFWWQPLKESEFTISPMKGTIAAQTNVSFTITYRPVNHNPFVKVWASCNIENYMPLELALYATCMDIGNVQNKTLYMECPVREVKTDFITVVNPTDDLWLVLSENTGGPFETLKEFHVEPNSTFDIPMNFKPKTMGRHECQVSYSPLAESALFVTVTGVANVPNPNGNIEISMAAKDLHTEELRVFNITENPETYLVSTEVEKVIPDKFEAYYEIKHPETIKTWGEASATCRWTFVCYEECEMYLKVMFINDVTREYQFYNIVASVTASPIVATLSFVSRARESVQKEILIKNPLSTDADYYIRSEQLECVDFLSIKRNSKTSLTLTFSPLVVGNFEENLEVTNQLVGTSVYKVHLQCLPAKEKTLEFATSFGGRIPIRLRVQNKTDVKTIFACQVSHPSIQADAEYCLGPSEKGKFLVWFEPTEIGLQIIRISFDSATAGEFVFNIRGRADRPKPQGPYEIKAGGYVNIMFKNVFTDARTFQISVDNPDFYVKSLYDVVRPKQEMQIFVYLVNAPESGWSKLPTGTLTIHSFDPPTPQVHWTFFLQGIP